MGGEDRASILSTEGSVKAVKDLFQYLSKAMTVGWVFCFLLFVFFPE